MKRHTVVHRVGLGILLLCCLGGVNYSHGLAVAAEPGAARPTYPAGFAPGVRVTLLEDAPAAGAGLKTGMSGTIVCCDMADCTGSLVVCWDLYSGGSEDPRCATDLIGSYPPGSTASVNPAEVKLGLPFDETGILHEDPEGCLYLATDDGGLFYLVVGPEFREQWWMVKHGNGVRVRGLLNRSPVDPKSGRLCSQRDGDIYHPIMSLTTWMGASCCDRWTCGFSYGDRVVLISADNPNGATDLPRGATGTIICCRSNEEQSILVSWDLWANGGDDDAYTECTERLSGIFPPGSTWWVSVKDVAKVFASACGTLQQMTLCVGKECLDPSAVGLFAGSMEVYYLPDVDLGQPLPMGRFRASGLLTPYGTLLNGEVIASDGVIRQDLTGMLLHSILIPCPEPSCCEPPYQPGDRVELLVSEPGGATGLIVGAAGSVVCCDPLDPVTPIFVSWDDWAGGDDNDEACGFRPPWYPDKSGWWMACSELRRLVLADLHDVAGGFHGLLPSTLVAGQEGQILKVSGEIGNRGGVTSDSFLVAIYVSTDAKITTTDYLLSQAGMRIDAGGSATLSWMGNFPTDIAAGTYYVGWLIDPDNRVAEENELNNTGPIEALQLTVMSK